MILSSNDDKMNKSNEMSHCSRVHFMYDSGEKRICDAQVSFAGLCADCLKEEEMVGPIPRYHLRVNIPIHLMNHQKTNKKKSLNMISFKVIGK